MADLQQTVNAVFRLESARVIAALTRIVRDVGLAEELAQDALLHALEQWPRIGVPDNPAAWLMGAAKHRAINALRRGQMLESKHAQLAHEEETHEPQLDAALDDPVGDDVLRLMFIACHPVLPVEGRVALTLRMIGGLATDEIARAFLVPEATVAQRIVRAKKTLAEAKVPFEVPQATELAERLSSVVGVIYLVFNEGYSATAGEDVLKPQLCHDALRLGRMLAMLAPDEPEVHGVVALMELNAARTPARTGPGGDAVLLMDQERWRWDRLLIDRGLHALERARALGGGGPYVLQAEIAACHARATVAKDTDWPRIAALYGELVAVAPSPVVQLNRAMAIAMAQGPAAGLERIDALLGVAALKAYPLLPAARADLLVKLGRPAEARAEFERAAALTQNARQREKLLERAAACARS